VREADLACCSLVPRCIFRGSCLSSIASLKGDLHECPRVKRRVRYHEMSSCLLHDQALFGPTDRRGDYPCLQISYSLSDAIVNVVVAMFEM